MIAKFCPWQVITGQEVISQQSITLKTEAETTVEDVDGVIETEIVGM